ncbi:uncharacterized protein ARMOST_02237 [Armillaria ostoyae]|uniref:Uncharacterized protein n=1 Tax=Armillaria ostoyae TaxID=47428 RepID=A0A284QR56_ARMOS|nr:uncharacterized protein ARMOST_02237 [Armillaria ostoyae]
MTAFSLIRGAQCFESGAVPWNLGEGEGAWAGAILGSVGTLSPTCLMAFPGTMFVLVPFGEYCPIGRISAIDGACTSPENSALTKLGLRWRA